MGPWDCKYRALKCIHDCQTASDRYALRKSQLLRISWRIGIGVNCTKDRLRPVGSSPVSEEFVLANGPTHPAYSHAFSESLRQHAAPSLRRAP